MLNIKITAEVDGKIIPLNTISAETFEAIKALEKPKEIPVARLAITAGGRGSRLLFKPAQKITFEHGRVYALDLKHGILTNSWPLLTDEDEVSLYYKNVSSI